MTDVKHYAYRVLWSLEDGQYVAAAEERVSLNRLVSDRLAHS